MKISMYTAPTVFVIFPGDFAILIQSGMSFRRAMCFNFLSACTAFIGFIIGICLGNMEYSGFVFSFAGGLFLFITLTHLVSSRGNTTILRTNYAKLVTTPHRNIRTSKCNLARHHDRIEYFLYNIHEQL